MLIMESTLYSDVLNFFRNKFANIVLLALLAAFISMILENMLSPSGEQLISLINIIHIGNNVYMSLQQFVQHMSAEQKCVLLKASAASAVSTLIGNVLLVGWLLTMIRLVSNRQPTNLLCTIWLSASLLPRLLLLIFIMTLLVQLGLLLVIVPGIFLAIIFSMAPVITTNDNIGAIKSICLSANLALTNLRLLGPAVLLWILAKAVVLLLTTQFTLISSFLAMVLLNSLNNLISALLLIYLYRLYMLLQKV